MKFDVVYTWVDGSNEDYIDTWNSYAKIKKDRNPERYRDAFELLKYSIRSLEQYFNSFNKLYLVTARPQLPKWLDINHERIQVIHHDEIIPEKYLPTFNSNVIESFIHKIPGLSDNFLYMNDDYLFGKPTSIDRFYKDSKHTVFNTFLGENLWWRIYDNYRQLFSFGIIEHNPIMINKAFWENAYQLFPEQTEATRSSRFRDGKNLLPYKLYRYYMLRHQRKVSRPINVFKLLSVFRFHKLTNAISSQQQFIAKMQKTPPEFYCMNDDMGENPNLEAVVLVKNFLERIYPIPSSFEIKSTLP